MKLKPLSNHIVIEPIGEEKATASGIILPDSAEKKRPQKGTIIAVGPGKLNEKGERIPLEVKIGDVILFQEYGLSEFKIENKEYLVGSESDIIAIIEQ